MTLVTIAAVTIASLGGHNVKKVECMHDVCQARASFATSYTLLDTGEDRFMIGRCKVVIQFRHREFEWMETYLDTCKPIDKGQFYHNDARRRGLVS